MRFSIITPTYKRADLLVRAMQSVQAQTHKDWELIIVNDSPSDSSYTPIAASINDARIRYLVNTTNSGVNFSRNRALDNVSANSAWVIFLDDDDYLAPDALKNFHDLITQNPNYSWFVTNRAFKDGTPLTKIPKSNQVYSYIWNYLILRTIRGDVTHCIRTSTLHRTRFPKHTKQGEEWFFFYQLGLHTKLFYSDHNSTITDGYEETGLNFRKRDRAQQLEMIFLFFFEATRLGFAYRPSFLIYTAMRALRVFIK